MDDCFVSHDICSELKEEYQAGLENGIIIKTAGEDIIAHEGVLFVTSKYFRTVINNAKTTNGPNGKIEIDYTLYPYRVVKVI